VISCDIGDLGVDSTVTTTILVNATGEGYAVNNAQVSSDFIDPDMTNNTDSVTIKINPKMVKLFIPYLQRH
jgi:cobyrinic acid a,c-diamide synthase